MKKTKLIILTSALLVSLLAGIYLINNTGKNTNALNETTKTSEKPSTFDNMTSEKQLQFNNIQKNDRIVLKVAHNFPISHPQHMALVEKFIPMVEKGSDWNIRVEVYPNSQLVEEKQYIQGVRHGTVEMCIAGQDLTDLLPRTKVLQFPYLFDSYDEAKTILNGKLGVRITQGIEDLGIQGLAWSLNGFGQIFINNTESRNVKLATLTNLTGVDILTSMGFNAIPIEVEDMSMALKRKSVEGHDNPPLLSYYNGWYEDKGKIMITNHVIHPALYMVSSKFLNTLSEEYKTLIKNATRESADYEIELLKGQENEIFNTLKEKGILIETPDLASYKNAVSTLYDKWINNDKDLKEIFNELKK